MSDKQAEKKEASPPVQAGEGAGILPAEHRAIHNNDDDDDDDGYDDGDSALGEDETYSTASLTSSILKYRTLHGRTYHSERGNAQYWFSNDEQQNEVTDINHHALTLALGNKIYLAPLEKDKVKNALDVGTGTGIWAIDFADEFPDAEVIGTDISPIQPVWVPPNLRFEIEDCTQAWTFPTDHFDYIHLRWLVGSVDDWYLLIKRAYDCLAPGGWIESYEMSVMWESDDGSVTESTALGQWGKIFIEGGHRTGRSFTVVNEEIQRKAMEAAGFVDIQEKDIKQPIGRWPKDRRLKECGMYTQVVLEQDAEGYLLLLAHTLLGWSREEVIVYLAKLRGELKSGSYQAYYRQKVVWARKPAAP